MTREQIEDVITEIDQKHIDRYLNEVQKAKKRRKRLIMIPSIIAASLVLLVGGNFVFDRIFAPYIHLAGKGLDKYMVVAKTPKEKGKKLSEEEIRSYFQGQEERMIRHFKTTCGSEHDYFIIWKGFNVVSLEERGNIITDYYTEFLVINDEHEVVGCLCFSPYKDSITYGGEFYNDDQKEYFRRAFSEHPDEELIRIGYGNHELLLAPDNTVYCANDELLTRFREGVDYYSVLYNPYCIVKAEWYR